MTDAKERMLRRRLADVVNWLDHGTLEYLARAITSMDRYRAGLGLGSEVRAELEVILEAIHAEQHGRAAVEPIAGCK